MTIPRKMSTVEEKVKKTVMVALHGPRKLSGAREVRSIPDDVFARLCQAVSFAVGAGEEILCGPSSVSKCYAPICVMISLSPDLAASRNQQLRITFALYSAVLQKLAINPHDAVAVEEKIRNHAIERCARCTKVDLSAESHHHIMPHLFFEQENLA